MGRRNSRAHCTTSIRVNGDVWEVPFLFGVAYSKTYRSHAADPKHVAQSISDALLLIGYDASVEDVASWPRFKRVEAHVYAWYEHLSASDNAVPRHPKPAWLPERPWHGPHRGVGAGPGPTVVRPPPVLP